MSDQCTEERFLNDIARHNMTVLRDEGVYRHIKFSREDSSNFRFDLITWPGNLCYTGDMGTFVFRRLNDMFEFFRTDREYNKSRGRELAINPGYWSEKLESTSRFGKGHEEFDEDKFRRVINTYRIGWMRKLRDKGVDKDARRDLWEDVDSRVILSIDDGEHEACRAAYEFHHTVSLLQFQFDDLFEHIFQRYTFHFIWCCYALAWGIAKYDVEKPVAEEAAL